MRVTARDTKIKRKSKRPSTVLALLLIFNTAYLFPISFEEALAIEREGKSGEAIEAYKALIKNSDENYCEIVSRLVLLVSNIDEKRNLLKESLGKCNEPERRHTFYVALAGLEEISGNLEAAQKYFQSASLATPEKKDFISLLSSAVLLFELGDYRGAEAQATVITKTCKVDDLIYKAEVLLSRVFYATDREEKSLQIAFSMLKKEPEKQDPAAILWVVELSNLLEKSDLHARAVEMLLSEFPDTPEAAIYRGEIGRVPSPSAFLGRRQPNIESTDDKTIVASETVETAANTVLSVQTGSYSVRENAEYALKDLEKEGFAAEIRERTIGERVYYRVLIVNVASENADGVILALKEKGFEGFRVFE